DALASVAGLSALTGVIGDVSIRYNDVLTGISGWGALASIGGTLAIYDNDALVSVTGLSGLASIGGQLAISTNGVLTDISGLGVPSMSVGDLVAFVSNQNLCSSVIDAFVAQLTATGSVLKVGNNSGC